MREILYKYDNRGVYQTEQDTAFHDDAQMKLVAEPHDFSLALNGEVLRSTNFAGGAVTVSREGAAAFYDSEDRLLAQTEKTDRCFKKVQLVWEKDALSVRFGYVDVVDYYPNCDGESDRWGEKWVTERTVTYDLKDGILTVK